MKKIPKDNISKTPLSGGGIAKADERSLTVPGATVSSMPVLDEQAIRKDERIQTLTWLIGMVELLDGPAVQGRAGFKNWLATEVKRQTGGK